MSYIRFLDFQFSIKDHISIHIGAGDFPEILINNSFASARVSLYGGQVLSFCPVASENDLLFVSPDAVFDDGVAIRGGIPICWPWFGAADKSGLPAHGVARTQTWSIEKTVQLSDGSSEIVLQLPPGDYDEFQGLALSLRIRVGKTLLVELQTHNIGDTPQVVSQALHSYLRVQDVSECVIAGLDQSRFVDKLHSGDVSNVANGDLIINEATDRIYHTGTNRIRLKDQGLDRVITIQNSGNDETVVWNPGSALKDLSGDGFKQMICIESARLNPKAIPLQPDGTITLSTEIGME